MTVLDWQREKRGEMKKATRGRGGGGGKKGREGKIKEAVFTRRPVMKAFGLNAIRRNIPEWWLAWRSEKFIFPEKSEKPSANAE
jgi:hypothetical protein